MPEPLRDLQLEPRFGVPSCAMKTVLITGGTGYLGERLLPIAAKHAKVVAVARKPRALSRLYRPDKIDLLDRSSVFEAVRSIKPDAIIHAAALNPGVDDERMPAVNHSGTQFLAEAASEVGSRLVLVSTDMVHDGKKAPYADAAIPSPINAYGQSKADGETSALAAHSDTIAVRTSLIYGLESIDRGTAGFAHRLAAGDTLTLFSDVLRQPVWRDALALSLVKLAVELTDETGTLNLTGSDVLDRATFATLMLDFWQIPYAGSAIEHIKAADRPDLSGVPINAELSLLRASALGLPTPGVHEVLQAGSSAQPSRPSL